MIAAVALSGGIDSLVAAYVLKQQKIPVTGIHFVTGHVPFRHPHTGGPPTGAPAAEDNPHAARVRQMARQIGMDLHIIDCGRTFEKKIVQYFIAGYGSGLTPNPCVLCNRLIKFGVVLEAARKLGATHLATGHYAAAAPVGNRYRLLKGADPKKDQSYFLSMLSEEQLSRALFPLAGLRKEQVRQIAEQAGLQPVAQGESQDICFIPGGDYAAFLEMRTGSAFRPGPIVDARGRRIGTHKGLHRYTVGQRRGIDCPAESPYYVIRIDAENNRLVVGGKASLYSRECVVHPVNWLVPRPDKPLTVHTRIRYRHPGALSEIEPAGENRAVIRFKNLQAAVTPGQAAVCYLGDTVAAAGWIQKGPAMNHEEIA